jgi:hypothetical protein
VVGPDRCWHRDPVDGGGGLLLTAGTVALLFGVIEGPQLGWGSWPVVGSLILAIVMPYTSARSTPIRCMGCCSPSSAAAWAWPCRHFRG